nr:hypothetical protein [uncultured Pseudomonas sp.]
MADMGLLGFTPASTLVAQQHAEQQRQDEQRRREAVESSLAGHIRRGFEAAKTAKQEIERRLIDCAQRQKGIYPADKLAAIKAQGGSELYPKLSTTKCRAAAAWIRDILIPTSGRPWGLDPTPVSDIPPEYLQQFKQTLMQRLQADPEAAQKLTRETLETMLLQEIDKRARAAADNHENLIADQLAEGGWDDALELFIDDFATYPAAIMKGPLLERTPDLVWGDGWELMETQTIKPQFARVSPYDIYPSPDSADVDDGAFIIERERYTRTKLNRLRGVPGYSEEAVRMVLLEHGRGGLRDWLAVDSQRAVIEDRSGDWLNNHGETIEGLHYWGSAQGLMLLQWGMQPEQIPDPLDEYEIDAILIGRHVIRCVINRNPMGARPYHKASFQLVPGSFWGMAIPELMSDVQDMCCATARAQANNMAFSSGPQVEVDESRLMPGENPNEMFPLKRWRTKSNIGQASPSPAIRFFQPASMAGELMTVYSEWERRADDATNIPRYIYGSEKIGGAGNTASGLSMLMESANKGIKDAIRHIDRGLVRRAIHALWLFNMRYSQNQTIKGDCRVVARGASAMLQREQTQALRQQFLQVTANPVDMQILGVEGRAKLLRAVAELLDMPGLIPSDEEITARTNQQNQQQAQQIEQVAKLEQAQVEADVSVKQAEAQKTEAETQEILFELGATAALLKGATDAAGRATGQGAGAPANGKQPGLEGVPGHDPRIQGVGTFGP